RQKGPGRPSEPSWTPAPTSLSTADCSYTSTSMPRLSSASAAVSPPMPPPMMTTLGGDALATPCISVPRQAYCEYRHDYARIFAQRKYPVSRGETDHGMVRSLRRRGIRRVVRDG